MQDLKLIGRTRRLLVGASLLGLAVSIAMVAFWGHGYRATALIEITQRSGAYDPANPLALEPADKQLVAAEIERLRSPSVLGAALESQRHVISHALAPADVQRRLRVSQRGSGTGILAVSLRGDDPAMLRRMIDAVVAAYINQTVGSKIDIRVLDNATAMPYPTGPQRALIAIGGLIGGLFIGAIVAMLAGRALTRITARHDIGNNLGSAVLAVVPHSPVQHRNKKALPGKRATRLPVLALDNHGDEAVSGLHSLRTSIEVAMADARNNVVAISGPRADVGRSFVCRNVAAILGSVGRRVLLIDADRRGSGLHNDFGVGRTPGLAEVLCGQASMSKAVHYDLYRGLSLMPIGGHVPDLPSLFAESRFQTMLAQCQTIFDTIVIDTPPVSAGTDCIAIGKLSGLVVLVVRCGHHTPNELARSLNRLRKNHVDVSGFVFNDQHVACNATTGSGDHVD